MERGNGEEQGERPQGSSTTDPSAPCEFCGEPRGDATPCPHCGMQ
jgi:hypothetical protein